MDRLVNNLLCWAPGLRRPGAYLVGGAVRDHKLGLEPSDFDIAYEGDAIKLAWEVYKDFKDRTKAEFFQYPEFGVATVTYANSWKFDFASCRTEVYPKSGGMPKVKFGATIEMDLLRRDFTINAMAVNLYNGEEVEAVSASADLANRVIQVLHRRSFIDDPTRMLRALKYMGKTGFNLHPKTAELISFNLLDRVSTPRLMKEFS